MAVFIAGLISGNRKLFGLWIPEYDFQSIQHFSESVGTMCRMSIFVILGTQVDLASLAKIGTFVVLNRNYFT